MKNLFVIAFVLFTGVVFSQQSNVTKSEVKKEENSPTVNKKETQVEAKKIKPMSDADARRVPLVTPGKKTKAPIKKD